MAIAPRIGHAMLWAAFAVGAASLVVLALSPDEQPVARDAQVVKPRKAKLDTIGTCGVAERTEPAVEHGPTCGQADEDVPHSLMLANMPAHTE
jgi:hypothetical protein